MPSLATWAVLAVGFAVLVRVDPDGGFAGIRAAAAMAGECYSGESEWCDSSFVGRLPKIAASMAFDKLTPTAEQIAEKHAPGAHALAGKVAIVTGAAAGIGHETARVLLAHGCHVVLAVRSVARGEAALRAMAEAGAGSGKGTVLELDLSDLRSVERFAQAFLRLQLPLHLLINNAGIMMPGLTKKLSAQGHELHFAVNHLAHFLLTRLLEPKLLATGTDADPARAIYLTTSGIELWGGPAEGGGMAQQLPPFLPGGRAYHAFHAYTLSKAMNTLTAKEQQRRWEGAGQRRAVALSLNPGLVGGLLGGGGRTMLDEAGPLRGAFYSWPFAHAQKNLAQGAATSVFAALAKQVVGEVRNGTFYYQNSAADAPGGVSGHPEFFDAAVATEVWTRTVDVLG